MHYHLKIILEPADKTLEDAVRQVMEPFNRNSDPYDENVNYRVSFWNGYTIGGVYPHIKTDPHPGIEAINAFHVCFVSEIPDTLEVDRVIIASPICEEKDGKTRAISMYVTEIWNGCSHQKTDFDGNVIGAIERHNEHYKKHDFLLVKDDWLCVTVDYHR